MGGFEYKGHMPDSRKLGRQSQEGPEEGRDDSFHRSYPDTADSSPVSVQKRPAAAVPADACGKGGSRFLLLPTGYNAYLGDTDVMNSAPGLWTHQRGKSVASVVPRRPSMACL